jgi:peptidoglycan/LPS O-acetylase OafA/YrhL
MASRDPNIDLIRAAAISLVLIHHIGQFLPLLSGSAHRFASLGAHGVDLFFVLSGWLIGRLYWLEARSYGSVGVLRFWARRWFRTIPPYLIVLPIAFAAVHLARGEPFQWTYLVFLQNYQEKIPFFLVSWSLCVEEHFYLCLPIVLPLIAWLKIPMRVALPALLLLGSIARFVDPAALPGEPFGYSETASHLRFQGLILGVWFAHLSVFHAPAWSAVQGWFAKLLMPLLVGFLTIPYWSRWPVYYLGPTYVALLCGSVLAALTAAPALRVAMWRSTHYLALMSYSVYLTHSIVINVCLQLTDKAHIARELVTPLWLALILLVGFATYVIVERSTLLYRDRIVPRRGGTQKAVARPLLRTS